MVTKKSTVFLVFLTSLMCTWLFYLKYSVIAIEDRIHYIKKVIVEEEKNRHILRAEWKSLTSPERIQRLAKRHLNLQQMEAAQLHEFDLSLFNSEKSRYGKRTKKLSQLVNEILAENRSKDVELENINSKNLEEN